MRLLINIFCFCTLMCCIGSCEVLIFNIICTSAENLRHENNFKNIKLLDNMSLKCYLQTNGLKIYDKNELFILK